MRVLRAVFPLILLALAGACLAAKHELDITISGGDVGKNDYEMMPDGTFTSESHGSLAGMKIDTTLTGKFENGLLVAFELKQSAMGKSGSVSVANGKATIVSEGKTTTKDYKPSKAVFANFHPCLTATAAAAFDPKGAQTQKADVFLLDSMVSLSCDLTTKPAKTIDAGGQKVAVQVYGLTIATTGIDVYVTPKNEVVAWYVPTQKFKAVEAGYDSLFVDPTSLIPEISQPTSKSKKELKVMAAMRDGVELACDIARPDADGKFPAILVRTPYGRGESMIEGDFYAKRGYVFVSQDVRGRGDSKGEWVPFTHERKDGFDTIKWLAKQPWCDGNVGMIGGSYLGWVQWWAAVETPPALKCIVPQVSPPDPFFNMPIDHGIPMLFGAVWWGRVVAKQNVDASILSPMENADKFGVLPLTKVDDAVLGKDVPWMDEWWTHQTWSSFGESNFMKDMKNVKIPALMISGWWDGDGIGTKMNWATMRALKRTNQYLIDGPWTHFFNTTSKLGDVDYGPDAILELDSVYLRWFDHWLKGKPTLTPVPKVKVFETGANKWFDLTDWPDPRSKPMTLYMSSTGPANGKTSVGALSFTKPGAEDPDHYLYNPASLKVSKSEIEMDQSKASTVVDMKDAKDDELDYKTAPLDAPIDLCGPIQVELYISTSAVDTDFFASLMDIDANGVSRIVCQPGKIRAKYWKSFDKPELLKPGAVYKLNLDLWDVAHRFDKGHRIALVIQSAAFPGYARNLNTGEPDATATRMLAAAQTVYHDAKHPSALKFMLLPVK